MMKRMVFIGLCFFFLGSVLSCRFTNKSGELPYIGERKIVGEDTFYKTIPPFELPDQKNVLINNDSLKGKVYVADFIFLNCTSICPIMGRNMLKVYEAFKGNPMVKIVSHTIDPERDSIAALDAHATALGIDEKQWMFLRPEKEQVKPLAKEYFADVAKDTINPYSYIHSGGFAIIDEQGHIRGIYDGTDMDDVQRMIADIQRYLQRKKP